MAKSGVSFKSAKFYKDAKIAIASVYVCICVYSNKPQRVCLPFIPKKQIENHINHLNQYLRLGSKGKLLVYILSKVFQMMPNNQKIVLKAFRQNLLGMGVGIESGSQDKDPTLYSPPTHLMLSSVVPYQCGLSFSQRNLSHLIAEHARQAIHLAPLPIQTLEGWAVFISFSLAEPFHFQIKASQGKHDNHNQDIFRNIKSSRKHDTNTSIMIEVRNYGYQELCGLCAS